MTFRRTAATAAVLGAIALAGAPLAAAAPTPKPAPKPNAASARAVPGTSCTVGQLRVAIDRSSPGLAKRLEDAAREVLGAVADAGAGVEPAVGAVGRGKHADGEHQGPLHSILCAGLRAISPLAPAAPVAYPSQWDTPPQRGAI